MGEVIPTKFSNLKKKKKKKSCSSRKSTMGKIIFAGNSYPPMIRVQNASFNSYSCMSMKKKKKKNKNKTHRKTSDNVFNHAFLRSDHVSHMSDLSL